MLLQKIKCIIPVNGKVKVKCTLVQALRLCTGHNTHTQSDNYIMRLILF